MQFATHCQYKPELPPYEVGRVVQLFHPNYSDFAEADADALRDAGVEIATVKLDPDVQVVAERLGEILRNGDLISTNGGDGSRSLQVRGLLLAHEQGAPLVPSVAAGGGTANDSFADAVGRRVKGTIAEYLHELTIGQAHTLTATQKSTDPFRPAGPVVHTAVNYLGLGSSAVGMERVKQDWYVHGVKGWRDLLLGLSGLFSKGDFWYAYDSGARERVTDMTFCISGTMAKVGSMAVSPFVPYFRACQTGLTVGERIDSAAAMMLPNVEPGVKLEQFSFTLLSPTFLEIDGELPTIVRENTAFSIELGKTYPYVSRRVKNGQAIELTAG